MSLAIGPDSTVGALLDEYPDLEPVLIEMAPAFAKLRNPLVRRTVAKVATLEQAARIGGVSLQEMIRRLREVAGQGPAENTFAPAEVGEEDAGWIESGRAALDLDADAMLERGVHPIGTIREAVRTLSPGEFVVLRSSFRPEPLIEMMRRSGVRVHCSAAGGGYLTRFGSTRKVTG